MTPDEARASFDAALDGELDADTKRAFDALLANDPALRREYESYESTLKATSALGALPPVDILSGVQAKLRERSGGRFYRDRFAEARGRAPTLTWILLLSTAVLVAVAVWLAMDAFAGGVKAP